MASKSEINRSQPYQRVATPPSPVIRAHKDLAKEIRDNEKHKKQGDHYFKVISEKEQQHEDLTWEEKVAKAKEVYEAQYDKIVKEDSTSKVGLSYVGRKLMKLFPSAKVEALTDEDSMKHWSMPTAERMLLTKQKMQIDLAKTAGLDLKANFSNSSQWHVNDSIQPKSQEILAAALIHLVERVHDREDY